jgi:NAD(P)-dependent dehydrogenase (short-subunit alcohol dehydrogenase family)
MEAKIMSDRGVALVTGASNGIGEAVAVALQQDGFRVYAGARRVERMDRLRELGIRPLRLDVTDDESMLGAIELIHQEARAVDVLVNSAGYGSYGALEDVGMKEAHRQIEVNLFGLARMTQLIVPEMRLARKGTIINISSIGGKLGEAFGAWYHASKYAVEGLGDSLALELAPFGIKVVTVEPGGIKSEWTDIAANSLVSASGNGAYGVAAERKAQRMRRFNNSRLVGTPEQVARGVVRITHKRTPKFRYAIGGGAKPLMLLRRMTSDRVFYAVFRRLAG